MKLDKKVSAGEVKFVLAAGIGKVVWGQNVPESLIHATIN
jgi:3-dehydroquinate synthetase